MRERTGGLDELDSPIPAVRERGRVHRRICRGGGIARSGVAVFDLQGKLMFKIKKCLVNLLVVLPLLGAVFFATPVYASQDYAEPQEPLEIPVFNSAEERDEYLCKKTNELELNARSARNTRFIVTATRIGGAGGSACEFRIFWQGSDLINAFRYNEFIVKDPSLLSYKEYIHKGGPFSWEYINFNAALTGQARITTGSIPTSVEKVVVKMTGLQVYVLSNGWVSTISIGGDTYIH